MSHEHIWTCGVCGKPFINEDDLRDHTDRRDASGEQHDGEPWGSLKPRVVAEWTLDCGGKKSFDGEVVVLSSRYWPGGHWPAGSIVVTPKDHNGHQYMNAEPYTRRHHAHTSICLVKGIQGDHVQVADEHFFGDSFDEVKVAVEAWASVMVARVWRAVIAEFASHEPERGWSETNTLE